MNVTGEKLELIKKSVKKLKDWIELVESLFLETKNKQGELNSILEDDKMFLPGHCATMPVQYVAKQF